MQKAGRALVVAARADPQKACPAPLHNLRLPLTETRTITPMGSVSYFWASARAMVLKKDK